MKNTARLPAVFGFFSILFIIFASVQFNDPDPVIWVSIYGIAAILSAFMAFQKFYFYMYLTAAIVGLIGGLYFFPPSVTNWMVQEWEQGNLSMKTAEMEGARESFGLLFISAVMFFAAYISWVLQKRKKRKAF